MVNKSLGTLDLTGNNRKSLWDIIQQIPSSQIPSSQIPNQIPSEDTAAESAEPPQEQPLIEPVINEARESPDIKLLHQLNEVTRLLEQQTTILMAQQKLLEDLTGRQKQPVKRKPGVAKKLKSLIHKGKAIWNVL